MSNGLTRDLDLEEISQQPTFFVEVLPSLDLQAFIRRFIITGVNQPLLAPLKMPTPGSSILTYVYQGDKHYVSNQMNNKLPFFDRLGVGGQILDYDLRLRAGITFGILLVEFTPMGLSKLFDMRASEITDMALDISDFLGKDGEELREKLDEVSTHRERFKIFEDFFQRLFTKNHKKVNRFDDRYQDIRQALYWISKCLMEGEGSVSVKQLSNQVRLSERHFRRKFEEVVGLPPRYYLRVIRYKYVMGLISTYPQLSITDLTYRAGYYDLAHFSKEFKHFTGMPPNKFKKKGSLLVRDYNKLAESERVE